jgi:hypothetical protein
MIFEIKFASVTNDTAETSVKTHIYHYTTPSETAACDRQLHHSLIQAILIF